MSETAERFLSAARRGDWDRAYYYLNGLNMYEMLRSLAQLRPQTLISMQWQGLQYVRQYNIPRIEYALRVVIERRLPVGPPGDLRETGQERTAQEFLNDIPKPPPLPRCRQKCPTCNGDCLEILGHSGSHKCGQGHTW